MKNDNTLGAYNIFDLREMAQRRVPKGLFEFVDRGTDDEVSLRNNRSVFERIRFKPRTLVDVSKRTQEITLFGKKQSSPFIVAPTGLAGLMWYEGEMALARAAKAAGIPFTLATGSLTSMEQVASEVGGRLWFQLYMWSKVALSHELVHRAKDAGYEALLLTVDSAVSGNREYNLRNGFSIPFKFNRKNVTDVLTHPRWMCEVLGRYLMTTGMPIYRNYPAEVMTTVTAAARPFGRSMMKCEQMNYEHLRDLRRIWPGLLMIKGIAHPGDALKAMECGVDAVVVSNHGGRNLDGSMSPLEALPAIVDAVRGRIPVLVDGGYRRGSDIVKALALGASAVLVGRATLYGTGAGGEAGAARAIAILREEIDRVMALLGCNSVEALGRELLHFTDNGFDVPAGTERQRLESLPLSA
jgi:isopentenyl diphosphate isomerase/L-lactate dehydrogenase-like FMN-dependent dehydrogenase